MTTPLVTIGTLSTLHAPRDTTFVASVEIIGAISATVQVGADDVSGWTITAPTDGTNNWIIRGPMPDTLADFNLQITATPGAVTQLTARPARAFSTRRLLDDYVGQCMRVRRISDNAEQDIGFDVNGNLDQAALTLFIGMDTAVVSRWYDQSGGNFDAIQPDGGYQPVIVQSGVIHKVGGIVCVFIDHNCLYFDNSTGLRDDFTLSAVFSTTLSNGYGSVGQGYGMSGFLYGDRSGNSQDMGFGNLGNTLALWGGGPQGEQGVKANTVINDGIMHVGIVARTSSTGYADIYLDGTLDGSGFGPVGTRVDEAYLQIGSAGAAPGEDGSPSASVFSTPEIIAYGSSISGADLALLMSVQALFIGVV